MSDSDNRLGDKEQGFSLLFSSIGMTLGPSAFGYGSDDWSYQRIALGTLIGGVGYLAGSALGRWLDAHARR